MQLSTIIANFLVLVSTILALPLTKRLYRPSSPVFSIIAHHEGAVFQYNLLKTNGKDLVLNGDEKAFFGRVRASEGYVLNLPGSIHSSNKNVTQGVASTTNVHVDPETFRLTTTNSSANSTHGFGIDLQKLTFRNDSGFLACPSNSYRGEYYLFWGNHNQTACPNNATGYPVELIVQTDASINYNPDTNSRNSTIPAVSEKKKRFWFF